MKDKGGTGRSAGPPAPPYAVTHDLEAESLGAVRAEVLPER